MFPLLYSKRKAQHLWPYPVGSIMHWCGGRYRYATYFIELTLCFWNRRDRKYPADKRNGIMLRIIKAISQPLARASACIYDTAKNTITMISNLAYYSVSYPQPIQPNKLFHFLQDCWHSHIRKFPSGEYPLSPTDTKQNSCKIFSQAEYFQISSQRRNFWMIIMQQMPFFPWNEVVQLSFDNTELDWLMSCHAIFFDNISDISLVRQDCPVLVPAQWGKKLYYSATLSSLKS